MPLADVSSTAEDGDDWYTWSGEEVPEQEIKGEAISDIDDSEEEDATPKKPRVECKADGGKGKTAQKRAGISLKASGMIYYSIYFIFSIQLIPRHPYACIRIHTHACTVYTRYMAHPHIAAHDAERLAQIEADDSDDSDSNDLMLLLLMQLLQQTQQAQQRAQRDQRLMILMMAMIGGLF